MDGEAEDEKESKDSSNKASIVEGEWKGKYSNAKITLCEMYDRITGSETGHC